MSSSHQPRIEELRTTIASRLQRVCLDWPMDRFEAMVRNLASITLKYERQLLPNDMSSTEELIQQMKALRQRSAEQRRRGTNFQDLSAAS